MLNFDKNYFQGETRDDFYIEPMMKCAWAAQLEVLMVIDGICKKHDIKYYAAFGTLLGAVRHHGFIPWDDDVDITMLREDYDRFMQVVRDELPDEYSINIPGETHLYDMTFSRVVNARTISYNPDRLAKFHGFPYIAGVDIFPLDAIPNNLGERNVFLQFYNILVSACMKMEKNPEEVEEALGEIEELCHYKFDRNTDLQDQLCLMGDTISKSYANEPNADLMHIAYNYKNVIHKREWYKDTLWLPFENIKIPIPSGYDEILKATYGEYMKPSRAKAAHDYPFYKKQYDLMVDMLVKYKMDQAGLQETEE